MGRLMGVWRQVWRQVLLTAVLLSTGSGASIPAVNWEACHDELDQASPFLSDASDAADEVHSRREEYEDCRRDPDTFDLMGDGCRSLRSDYEDAVSDFKSKMEELGVRMRSVQSSCAYQF